jgi:hypothetical protein
MENLSLIGLVTLYILTGLLSFVSIVLWWWQTQIFKGKTMDNPDGSKDDWHEKDILFGMAAADIFIACPMAILSVILILFGSKWGFYLLALDSFFFVWINTATTTTSIRFHKPKITMEWFIIFPFGAILGFAFIVWTVVHFDIIYA